MHYKKRNLNGNYTNLMADGYSSDSRYILAESGKIHDPTTEQIDEEEDEMKETSNIIGNSTTQVLSESKKIDYEKPVPKTNNLLPKPQAKPIQPSKSAMNGPLPSHS
jgi:hypothetical protein